MARTNTGPRLIRRQGWWYIRWTESAGTVQRSLRTKDYTDALHRFQSFIHGDTDCNNVRRLVRRLLETSRWNAKRRSMSFNLTVDDIHRMLEQNGYRCAVTWIPFDVTPAPAKNARRPWVPSIDRIDRTAGYTPDNVRLVCAAANFAMNMWGEDVLARLARAYAERKGLLRDDVSKDTTSTKWAAADDFVARVTESGNGKRS